MDNRYHRDYNNRRYSRVRERLVSMLGGQCVKCGSTENLQFDHVDPSTKSFNVSEGWARKWFLVVEEINKCQLLCFSCHRKKTLKDCNQQDARKSHGTLSSYRYCKCSLCREAKAKYNRAHKYKRANAAKA